MFDFETDSTDPETCNPVQVACLAIDPYTLEMVPGSEFCSDMRPPNIDDEDYGKDAKTDSTIKWHMKTQGKTREEILERWRAAPLEKDVWKNFVQHVNKYNVKRSQKAAPVACGVNIINFDLVIADQLTQKYKTGRLFNYEVVDLRHLFFMSIACWDQDVNSISMDNMRKYFAQEVTNSHDALQDVIDEAEFVVRYLRFFKNTFERKNNPYKGCMKK